MGQAHSDPSGEAMSFLPWHFNLGGHAITLHGDTLVYSWCAILLLIGLALAARRRLGLIPGGLANLFELIFSYFEDLGHDMIGKGAVRYIPFVATLFLFVLVCNWISLIPIITLPPTRDFNTTLALAIISFVGFNYFGIRKYVERARKAAEKSGQGTGGTMARGLLNWLLHFIDPVPEIFRSLDGALKWAICPVLLVLFIIVNIVEEVFRMVSLSVRLFGNVMGEHVVSVMLLWLTIYISLKLMVPILWVSSVFVLLLGALTGFIQAFIFAVLTLSYIGHLVEEH